VRAPACCVATRAPRAEPRWWPDEARRAGLRRAPAGAAQADAALLLVDGSPGGFEAGFEGSDGGSNGHAGGALLGGGAAAPGFGGAGGGQTREHAQLARSLGVEQLAVVVSKLDTCGYSQVWRLGLD
jgi:translation elongation factor EF-1alpha